MVRTILVTGSNQGLGMHTVHQLGSTPDVLVFMGSRKLAAAEEALSKFAADIHSSSTVVPVQLDITDASSIKAVHAFVSDFLNERGIPGLDVLVNNAAIFVPSFQETYTVNVFGTVAITEAFRPLLSKGGAILNISSGLGSMASYPKRPKPRPLLPAYASSKAALNMLTVQWAMQEEEKGSGIRVVSICPGFNATNLNNYAGTMSPADGCKVIVKAALEKEGRTGVFFNKDGDNQW
ncbi:Short-chain dehydrogenase/reductase family protein [Mycena venus]|uniref:Short-chain dehydrogenase/reductase family protein n=1 Tax=Mycena venus TaxID=2733690 RepID=A0A8H6YPF4_9AGAR|nr:Short-chain dehydrogenase/reductase family protein [Mycena venus]